MLQNKFLLKRMPNINFPSKPRKICEFFLRDEDGGYIKYKGEELEDKTVSYFCSSKESMEEEETFDESIDHNEFIKKYKQSDRKISKMRFFYTDENNNQWIIDHYTMFNLIIARVNHDRQFAIFNNIPSEIEKTIIMNVTDQAQFDDYMLADNYEV